MLLDRAGKVSGGKQKRNSLGRPSAKSTNHSLSDAVSPSVLSSPSGGIVNHAAAPTDIREADKSSKLLCEGLSPAVLSATENAVRTGIVAATPFDPDNPLDSGSNREIRGSRELSGRIEGATASTIAGWVWNPQRPDERIRLELLDGERQVATIIADKFRRDLIPLGCGDGQHGFDIALADGLLSDERHILTLRCADSGAAVPGSPIVVEGRRGGAETRELLPGSPDSERESAFRGYIDKVTDAEILGWIIRPERPADRCIVSLTDRKRILARAVASQFRGDLLSAGVGDGCHAFVLEPPPSLLDGEEHLLEVVEEESGLSITAEPIRWRSGPSFGDSQPVTSEPGYRLVESDRWRNQNNETATKIPDLHGSSNPIQDKYHFRLQGPLKGEYSLAVVNRHFAAALIRAGQDVVLIPQETDLAKDPAFAGSPELSSRLLGRRTVAGRQICSTNDWPVRTPDASGINAIHCFAWEESVVPFDIAARLSRFDLIATASSFVTRSLLNSGVTSQVVTIGNGVDHIPRPGMHRQLRAQDAGRPFVFLHVSSCFPRKGGDVLLDAYFSEFSEADNVRLVIKTFDNPHNRGLRQDIAARRSSHENPPALDVRIVSLDDDSYYKLFVDADCLVAPSYGEGFLFPAAEALLNNVPVIATNWGGHLDFCSDGEAWLIDARLEKSTSHVAGSGSLWAIPSRDHLRRLMREMTQLPVPERASRIVRGQQRLEHNFRWIDVARRYFDALTPILLKGDTVTLDSERRGVSSVDDRDIRPLEVPRALSNKASAEPISSKPTGRHVVISTFGQQCGIATFTAELLEAASARAEIVGVVSEVTDRPEPAHDALDGPIPIRRVWRRHSSFIPAIISAVMDFRPDHVLIEHHPGIFGWDMLSAIVLGLNGQARVTIELHSCDGYPALVAAAASLQFVNRFITHNGPDYMLVAKLFGTDKTSLIPHGISAPLAIADCRRDPDGAEAVRLASFGMAGPHKGFHKVIEAMALLRQTGLDVGYHLFTSFSADSQRSRDYLKYCIERAHQLGVEDHLHIDFRFLPIGELVTRLGACHIGVMPYDDDVTEGASGAARVMLRANLPLVLTAAPIFGEFRGVGLTADGKGFALARELYQLILSPERHGQVLERQAKFALQTSWTNVAQMVFGCFDAY